MRRFLFVFLIVALTQTTAFTAETLDVFFIDVGAGDAILIDCGDWEALLDAGPGTSMTDAAVLDVLAARVDDGVLELAILSHNHSDHYGGFRAVLETYEVSDFWRSSDAVPDTSGTKYQAFRNALVAKVPTVTTRVAGEVVPVGPTEWEVLAPITPFGSTPNDNENSLVLVMRFGDVEMLFPGDIEGRGEGALISTDRLGGGPRILKVSHHGSETSTSLAFLGWASPTLAVISTDYSQPPAASNLLLAGIPFYTTERDGSICLSTDGHTWTVHLHYAPTQAAAPPQSQNTSPPPGPAHGSAPGLLINEVEMNPPGSDSGTEWIEIYNPTERAVSLASWAASYTGYGGGWAPLPAVTIQPGGYYRFVYPKQHLENSRGEVIQLRNHLGQTVDATPPGLTDEADDLRTWQRVPDGMDTDSRTDWTFKNATPGAAN
jgi:beta-lactamase superfamily II metal-dependent hydrolase